MRIDEFDEYQGLTADMVRAWLTSHGATQSDEGNWWFRDELFSNRALGSDYDIKRIQTLTGYKSLPSLLREINPRLRDGWPSETALDAHDGWVIWVETVGAFAIWDAATVRERKQHAPDAKVRCWPCDEFGNKIRWPTDEHGNLL